MTPKQHTRDLPQIPQIDPKDLLDLAQYALAAAHARLNNRLDSQADALMSEWVKALPYVRRALREFQDSAAARAARLALGMLLRPQLARDAAMVECTALLEQNESLRDALADARWEESGEMIARDLIDTYHGALLAATEVTR